MNRPDTRDRFTGTAIALFEDNIDTDRILPARYLKELTFDNYGEYVFESDRDAARAIESAHPFDDPATRQAKILISRANFGTGSSREGAPQALMRWGIQVIIAVSFGEIFRGNAAAIGVPCLTIATDDVEEIAQLLHDAPGTVVEVSLGALELAASGKRWPLQLDETQRTMFRTGTWDTLGTLLTTLDDVRSAASRMPYLNAWTN
jgi:3-isopropylmalate/(R)-2-methylmalate dehydratase small subunit